jgi:hypothetical protein
MRFSPKVRRRARIATDKLALRERVLLATVRLAAQARASAPVAAGLSSRGSEH